ncbi:MAG: Crp/Fnr family transcriptional regulator [Mucilaginibacter sp.]|nr:Crp/Fnr family transcriptional regulator [Mucilaginibacter sp.]
MLKTPSKYCIETTEKTQVLQLNAQQMEQLIADVPAWSDLMLQNDLDQAIRTQTRINAVINMNAVERYQDMRRSYPDYEDRFSQTAIASYLGIQPETLSRLRKRWGLRPC